MASTAPVAEPVPASADPVPAVEPTKTEDKPKRTYKKRKAAATPAPPPVEAATPDDALKPLPEDATGFRKRSKKDDYTPVPSSSVPGMSVGEVRKCLNQIRKAGEAIRMEHLLYNGWPAGRFALSILQGNHNKRRERKAAKDGEAESAEGEEDEEIPAVADVEAPAAAH